ncbi:MAG: sigma-54 dependent transcriptional regulator [bacterium]|nr:sigma-54 dependent transcriptional regulator [bacterium]MDT8367503.1 sigma-54 dependent transcriptional regulator [bacterium]
MAKKILVIEDDQSMRWVLEKSLSREGYKVTSAPDGRSGIAAAFEVTPDLVILDILMPDIDGLTVLRKLKESHPQLPVLIITAQNIMTHAVEAMRRGAYDYLPKPFDISVLLERVDRGLAQIETADSQREAEAIPAEMEDMIGTSPLMEGLFKAMGRVAASDATVLVLGESGTGKELVARAIHRFSNRASGPFVAVNASAIPGELLESVLFGHEKGAFTGATDTRKGKFELAAGGTLFLDEIGDMPGNLQAKILRVLENREFERVGGQRSLRSDVRVISATHRELWEAVKEGDFREDLYYRLNVVSLRIPPLRERREDIPVLAGHFLRVFAEEEGSELRTLSEGAMSVLLKHVWPGNVRELLNTLKRAYVLASDPVIHTSDLGLSMEGSDKGVEETFDEFIRKWMHEIVAPWSTIEEGDLYEQVMSRVEMPMFEMVMEAVKGNQVRAAKVLGINRNTLRERLRKYDLLKKGGKKKK